MADWSETILMKKKRIINARLSGYIAALGHMDFL